MLPNLVNETFLAEKDRIRRMIEIMVVIFIGLIGGAAVGFQSPIAGAMGQRLGSSASSFIVHLGGAAISALFLFLRGGEQIRDWRSLPWYMLIAGGFGLILIYTISVTLPRLGAATMVMLIIVGQLVIGLLIDHFGWLGVSTHPISWTRALGVLVLLVGGYLIAR